MNKILGLAVDVSMPRDLRNQRQQWLSSIFPDTEVVVRSIPYGPAFMESSFEQALAGKPVLEEVIRAEEEGFAAVSLLCLSDPFLDACRESVRIPVIGAGQASFLIATAVATRTTVITINEGGLNVFSKLIKSCGISESTIPSIRSIDMSIDEMNTDPARVIERLKKVGQKALDEEKAQALILGCTEMGKNCQKKLSEHFNIPIIEPNTAAIAVAVSLIGMGITQSRLSFPPFKYSLEERYIKEKT